MQVNLTGVVFTHRSTGQQERKTYTVKSHNACVLQCEDTEGASHTFLLEEVLIQRSFWVRSGEAQPTTSPGMLSTLQPVELCIVRNGPIKGVS